MHSLPNLKSIEAFKAWRADPAQCLPVALDIARGHGLPHADPHLFATGTNLVVALDDGLILKIFPPFLRRQFVSERMSLSQLRGRLGVPIPEIVLEGERNRWPYLVITRLSGVLGTQAWPALPEDQKERILGQIGQTIARLKKEGFTILLVEQNFRFAATVADRYYIVEHGKVIDGFANADLQANMDKLHTYLGV